MAESFVALDTLGNSRFANLRHIVSFEDAEDDYDRVYVTLSTGVAVPTDESVNIEVFVKRMMEAIYG